MLGKQFALHCICANSLVNGFLIQEKQRSEAQTEILKQVHQLTLKEVTYLRDHQAARLEFIERLKCACRKLGMMDNQLDSLQPQVVLSADEQSAQSASKRGKKISLNLRILSHVTRLSSRRNSKRMPTVTSEVSEPSEADVSAALTELVISSPASTTDQ